MGYPTGAPWWQSATVYQIYPRSFADSNGDGIGDLDGIRRHLDHVAGLGVDAVWISPFFPSPMKDNGYDVSDYCNVDPVFGDLATFDALLAEAHERGLRVMIDWVPNHTSDQHPWFVSSRSSRSGPKSDWYLWVDGNPEKLPNNWPSAFMNGPAWTWSPERQQWYHHTFLPEQPDLNWRNPSLVEAMHDTLRFWLDRGVDGFRIDVVHGLLKLEGFPDAPERTDQYWNPETHLDLEGTIDLVKGFRRLLDSYPGDRAMVGEVYILSTHHVARFYGDGDALHMSFNFPPIYAPWDAAKWRDQIDRVIAELGPIDAWPTWVLSNHDNPRHATRYGSAGRARAAAVLLLTLRGTAFLYAGEELGLQDAVVPPDQQVDPVGRDGCRAPIPWTSSPGHGWAGSTPWLPWPPDPSINNAASLSAEPDSILHLYERVLAARRRSPALSLGAWDPLEVPEGVLGYTRSLGPDRRAVLLNFTASPVNVPVVAPVEGRWKVEVATSLALEGRAFDGSLGPDEAVVLIPAQVPAQKP